MSDLETLANTLPSCEIEDFSNASFGEKYETKEGLLWQFQEACRLNPDSEKMSVFYLKRETPMKFTLERANFTRDGMKC